MQKEYPVAYIMLPSAMRPHSLFDDLKKLQQMGMVNNTLIVLIPDLVYSDVKYWLSNYEIAFLTFHKLKNETEEKQELLYITIHGPELR